MSFQAERKEKWAAEITLGAADTTKTLVATPTGNRKAIVCTHLIAHVLIAAAQGVDIKIGSVNVKRLAASEAVGSEAFVGPMVEGIKGQAGQPFTIVPTAAGPSVHVLAEGYYDT